MTDLITRALEGDEMKVLIAKTILNGWVCLVIACGIGLMLWAAYGLMRMFWEHLPWSLVSLAGFFICCLARWAESIVGEGDHGSLR